jgi:hypothetical protein
VDFAAHLARADAAAVDHLGSVASYTPEGGEAVEVQGIFDAAYVLVDPGAGPGVSSCGPALFVRMADLPSDPREDEPSIEVAGVQYRVKEVRPDGQGGVLLLLSEV